MSLSSLSLDAFHICAQVGNFTRAAERLHITQSALSQRIKNLEMELETSLFIRDRAGIRLTEAGNRLLRYCQIKESLENEAIAEVKGKSSDKLSGHIRIGGFSSVMRSVVLPALAKIIDGNPDLRASFFSREIHELSSMLKRGEIDFMILDHPIARDDLVATHLGTEKNVLVSKKNTIPPDIYLDHDDNDETTLRYLRHSKQNTKIERRYFDDIYGIIEAAKLGLGKAVVPLHLIKNEKSIAVLRKKQVLSVPVILYFYKQDYYSKLHNAVVGELKLNSGALLE
jgi:DNA-binding transcriptional LysR family regulator